MTHKPVIQQIDKSLGATADRIEGSGAGALNSENPASVSQRVGPTAPRENGYVYSRYSTAGQKEMSIEAQQAVCDDLAAAMGVVIPAANRYYDKAKGGDAGSKRPSWEALVKRVRRGDVRYLFADEQSRLFRDEKEAHEFKELITKHGIVVIGRDIDTRVAQWEFMFSIRSAVNALELVTIRGRIKRSIAECLKRGHAVSDPGYGYKVVPVSKPNGEKDHSQMALDEVEALIVRRIFKERSSGKTIAEICRGLNADGVLSPGYRRATEAAVTDPKCYATWHCGSVQALLRRPLYKGVYKRGSTTVLMQDLAIVSAADWDSVQGPKRGPKIRGGGKEWAGGLCFCTCGSVLGVQQRIARHLGAYMFCMSCRHRRYLGQTMVPPTSTSEMYLRAAIEMAIAGFLTGERIEEYRNHIRSIGEMSNEQKIADVQKKLAYTSAIIQRLTKTLARSGQDDLKEIEDEINGAREERGRLKGELATLEEATQAVNNDVIRRQLMTDPQKVIEKLFDDSLPVYETRVMLARIFPQIVFEGKNPEWWRPKMKISREARAKRLRPGNLSTERQKGQATHFFLLTLNVGELLASFTGDSALDLGEAKIRVMVTQKFRQPIFISQMLEAPVMNAPDQPLCASQSPAIISRVRNLRALRTNMEAQRKLAETKADKPRLRVQFSRAERRRRKEARAKKGELRGTREEAALSTG